MNVEKQYTRYRKQNLYITLFISLFLMLFLLGVFGVLLINANHLNKYFKEKFTITVYFKQGTPVAVIKKTEKKLKNDTLVKDIVFISKERAAEKAKEILGEDFIEILGTNPLQDNLEIHLNARYVNDSIVKNFSSKLQKNKQISEVAYEQAVLDLLNKNIRQIGIIIMGLGLVLLFIIWLLIRNTVRLSIYNRRHIIKTMQLVGAPEGYIIRPIVWKNMLTGLLASVTAGASIYAALYYLKKYFQGLTFLSGLETYLYLFGGLIVFSLIITVFTSYFATRRILRMHADDIHF